jgi:hypothetical protein
MRTGFAVQKPSIEIGQEVEREMEIQRFQVLKKSI